MIYGKSISILTEGFSDIKDITDEIANIIAVSKIDSGIVTVFMQGSTASVSTVEYEPALAADVRDSLEAIVPHTMHSRHSQTWGDDNGFSHIRATLMGPGITVPFTSGRMKLGTWQQIVVIDHDNRPRSRKIFVQVMGE